MNGTETVEITRLLHRWSAGSREAAAEVMPLIYGDLRRIAGGFARRERPGHTLQPTALVHEAVLQLFGEKSIKWKSRTHFLSVAARVMRHVLVDYSRQKNCLKRGGRELRWLRSECFALGDVDPPDLVALDDALTSLARFDAEGARIVELRFFAGLSLEDTAACIGVSRTTVVRRWRRVRAWLYAEMAEGR